MTADGGVRERGALGAEARQALLHAQIAAPGEHTLADVAQRVATAVADAEPLGSRDACAERFARWIAEGDFLPSVPTLANAGRSGQLAACFVLEVSDSLESIYGALQRAARIQQGSGGVGVELSALRPRGTPIERSGGHSPGPVAFAELFARSAHVMALAGRRSGAHLAILADDHPDVVELVRTRREEPERFPQLGFAVGVSDALLRAAANGASWELRHERTTAHRVAARELLLEIARSILETGDPTLLFLDRIEADNPTPTLGRLRATNPCGEQPLLDGESCVLGSLQLPRFLRPDGSLDEPRLGAATRDAVRFLDDAIEVNAWPDERIAAAARRTRKVGLGVMGVADVLLLRGLAYDGREARALVDRILGCVAHEAEAATAALAEERGAFPALERGPRRRNAITRALAPTGTLRLLAGCSAGIEPFLDPCVTLVHEGRELPWVDTWLVDWLARRLDDPQLVLDALAAGVRHEDLPGLAGDERRMLRRAFEIAPDEQLAMQARAQRSVDGAVSKTVHIDPATILSPQELVGRVEHARRLGCKGVAFYRADVAPTPTRIDLDASCGHECGS